MKSQCIRQDISHLCGHLNPDLSESHFLKCLTQVFILIVIEESKGTLFALKLYIFLIPSTW